MCSLIKPVAPCKGCKKRYDECHKNCKEYKQYVKDNHEYKNKLIEKRKESEYTSSKRKAILKKLKERGR